MTTTTTPASWNVRGENLRIPAGDRRNPTIFLDLMIGQDWGVTCAIQHLRRSGFILRLPMAFDGGSGVRPSPDLMAAMEKAAFDAVQAHPVMFEYLISNYPQGKRKVGGKRQTAPAE